MKTFREFLKESREPKKNEYVKGMEALHGTGRQFDSFGKKPPQRHEYTTNAKEIEGHFFTTDLADASSYASRARKLAGPDGKAIVMRVRLNMNNPKDVTNEIKKHMKTGLSFGDAKRKAYSGVDREKHDGVYHRGTQYNKPEYVAFHGSKVEVLKNE
jgi:hypothetical protein